MQSETNPADLEEVISEWSQRSEFSERKFLCDRRYESSQRMPNERIDVITIDTDWGLVDGDLKKNIRGGVDGDNDLSKVDADENDFQLQNDRRNWDPS